MRFLMDQRGSTCIEYSTIVAMMGVSLILVIPNMAAIINVKLSSLGSALAPGSGLL